MLYNCKQFYLQHYDFYKHHQFTQGLPHLHGVFWLKEDAVKDYKKKDDNTQFDDSEIGKLIDNWISCSLENKIKIKKENGETEECPDDALNKLVSEVNVHKHTKTCRRGNYHCYCPHKIADAKGTRNEHTEACKKRNNFCRFSFPKLPSDRTLIAKPLSEEELGKTKCEEQRFNAKNLLDKVKEHLQGMEEEELQTRSLQSILDELEIESTAYHDALSISTRGEMVVLKRKPNEMWVNNYNPHFMKAWGANMDIQFCMDSYAVITYITDYLTKGDAGLTRELRKALLETKHCNDFEQLNHLKMCYFKHKQVSVAEATYRLVRGLDLKKSDTACIYVGTGFPKNRSSFFRPAHQSEKSTEVDNEEHDIEENVSGEIRLEGKKGQFKEVETIHQKYSQRPQSLRDVCLAQFATSYAYINKQKIPKKTEWENGSSTLRGDLKEFGTENFMPKYIELESGTFMALRTKPLILRIHSSKKKEYMEGIYSELLLYLPWEVENDLKEDHPTQCIELFNQNEETLKNNKKAIFPNSPMIDAMMALLDSPESTTPLHLADDIDSNAQQTDLDDQDELDVTNPLDTSELPPETNNNEQTKNKGPTKLDGSPFRPIPQGTKNELIRKARGLSFEQRIAFDKVLTFAKSVITAEKGKDPMSVTQPPLLIVHGGGGVGKSHLIKTVSQWTDNILRKGKDRDNPDFPTVMLLAYTGVAAKNIGGTTFHSGLSYNYGPELHEFTKEKLDLTRKQLENVELVIVDEFSMVSADNLYNLHFRLQKIFDSEELFGGRSIMLVGDIMQLPPVKGVPIYAEPTKSVAGQSMFNCDELNLWKNCESILLERNFRQGEGAWLQMLNRLRIGEPTEQDIKTLEDRPSTLLSKEQYDKAIHLFYTNLEVHKHNVDILNAIEEELEEIVARLFEPQGYKVGCLN